MAFLPKETDQSEQNDGANLQGLDKNRKILVQPIKMDIPQELYADEVIRFLPVEDILSLCQTSPTLSSICQDNDTWKYLIGRDFKIQYDGLDAVEEYHRLEEFQSLVSKEIISLTAKGKLKTRFDPSLDISQFPRRELGIFAKRLGIKNPSLSKTWA